MFKWHIITLFFIQSSSLVKLLQVSFLFVCFETELSAAQVTESISKNTQCCFEFLSILPMPLPKHQDRKHGPPHLGAFVFFMLWKKGIKDHQAQKQISCFLTFQNYTHIGKKNSLWMESKRTNCTHSFWPYYKPKCARLSTHISKLNS